MKVFSRCGRKSAAFQIWRTCHGVTFAYRAIKAEQHDYQLYLALNNIDHTKTKAKSPQTNGICERFHKTILDEFYKVTFRKKLYADLESLQQDLDDWLLYYNEQQTHQGKMCCGRTPLATLEDGKRIWKEKFVG